MCPGCPHRSTFYALKLAVPRDDSKIVLCGDIGCFGLGALPPLQMIDTLHHMGMSISMAQGISEALHPASAQEQPHLSLRGTKQSPAREQEIASSKTPRNDELVFYPKGWHPDHSGGHVTLAMTANKITQSRRMEYV
jgi:hypothetical protein